MITPVGVEALQKHHALELREVGFAHHGELGSEGLACSAQHLFEDLVVGDGFSALHFLLQGQRELPVIVQHPLERRQVPLLFHRLGRYVLPHQVGQAVVAHGLDQAGEFRCIQDLVALLVDHLALIVRNIVVFQQLLADVEVARFHLALR